MAAYVPAMSKSHWKNSLSEKQQQKKEEKNKAPRQNRKMTGSQHIHLSWR
jgi:hypothetical protein